MITCSRCHQEKTEDQFRSVRGRTTKQCQRCRDVGKIDNRKLRVKRGEVLKRVEIPPNEELTDEDYKIIDEELAKDGLTRDDVGKIYIDPITDQIKIHPKKKRSVVII
jgi:hypothetical protein